MGLVADSIGQRHSVSQDLSYLEHIGKRTSSTIAYVRVRAYNTLL